MNRPLFAVALLCATTAAFAAQKVEKDYPNKPIRVIVPSPAGGPPDLVMRMLLPFYSQSLGQPLVLDNRAGAGGVVGSATVAKGVPDGRVLWGHAFANALAPVLTVLALSFGGLVSGAVITETVFAWPGMGKAIYQAILDNDYNLALVGLLLATFATMLGNLLADLAYAWVDPRVSLAEKES